MEYILNVRRIIKLTDEEKKSRDDKRTRNYDTFPYPGGVGMDYDVKTVEVLSVVLTEEEYNRAKSSIINSKN